MEAAAQNEAFALGVLIFIGASTAGALAARFSPDGYGGFVGLAVANAVMAALVLAGVTVAGDMIVWFVALSVLFTASIA